MTERIAWYSIEKLKELGYDCELIKPNKSPRSWLVLPKNKDQMTAEEIKKFEAAKKKVVDEIKLDEAQALKELREFLIGK